MLACAPIAMVTELAPTALVIEDDAGIVELFEHLLREEGLRAVISRSGHNALELAERHRPSLVLLDLGLPGIYGTSVAIALKTRFPGLPIIVVSALRDQTVAQDAWVSGAFAYFTKPFDIEQFLGTVRRALRERPMVPPPMRAWPADQPPRTAA